MAQANAQLLNQYKAGKTAEQQRVIDYFCKEEGCMSKNMSDDEYSQMVIKKRDSLNLRAKALSKIGLDEDEVNEIPPALFEGYVFKNAFAKKRANGNWVSSAYQVAWLFFSSTQIYVYRYTFTSYGEDGIFVKNARAHVGKLSEFFVGDRLDNLGILDDPGICDQKARYVGPVFIDIGLAGTCNDRSRYIRTTS